MRVETVKVSQGHMVMNTKDEEEDIIHTSGKGIVFTAYQNPPTLGEINGLQEVCPKESRLCYDCGYVCNGI